MSEKILIFGTNDNATACAQRLFRAGFGISMVSRTTPSDLFYFRNYSSVISAGSRLINDIKAQTYADFLYHEQSKGPNLSLNAYIEFALQNRQISVLSANEFNIVSARFDYGIICDEQLYLSLKNNNPELILISCIPAKMEVCKYSIVPRGPYNGQVHYPFSEFEIPAGVEDKTIIYAEDEAVFIADKTAGDKIIEGEKIALLDNHPVLAPVEGYLAGILPSGIIVEKSQAIASISNLLTEDVKIIPQESFSIAGGVLEAILYDQKLND